MRKSLCFWLALAGWFTLLQPTAVRAQLLHRYDFETPGSANDTVGTAHGTRYGSATISGGALNTTGAAGGLSGGVPQNSVKLPAAAVAGLTGAFTIEVWYQCSYNGPWCTVYSFSDSTTANYLLATPAAGYDPYPSRVAVKGGGGNAAEQLANQIYCDTGVLRQMVVSYDGTTVTYYLDGALPTFSGLQNSFADPGLNLSSYIGIAGGAPYGDNTINGKVFDFRIYGQALTADQVAAIHSLGANPSNTAISAALQFSIAPKPTSMIAPQGGSGTSAIAVNRFSGFSGSVTLSATNLPVGVTASFSPQPATSNSVMTLTASSSVPIGHYNFSLVGSGGGATMTTPMLLMVTSNSAVAFKWPDYSPDLNYNFTNEYPAIETPTSVLDDCTGVTTTITLPDNWFCFRFGPDLNPQVTSNAWVPMLEKLDSDFRYFRDVMGWPPDKRAKRGYKSAVYLLGSGTCVGGGMWDTGGWMGSIRYNNEDWPMGLFSYVPVSSFDPAYWDPWQQGACTHEMIHSVLADMPGCKQACWFHEGGNTWLQGEAAARQSGNYSGMGWLSAGSMMAPFMPIECYSGWLQDDSFGGPCAEGVYQGDQYASTWRGLLGGVQYSEAFPHFMGEIVSQGSVAWIWRNCTNRVLEGLATAPGGLGDGQTRRLIMEYRARAAMCDFGKWSGAYTALLNNNWGVSIGPEYEPAWISCDPWTMRCYVVTTNIGRTLTPEWRTLPGWSGANQIPLQVAGVVGTTASVNFTPLGDNMTCQLVYRAADNSIVYGQPVSGGTCSIKFDKALKNNVVIAVICNTDWQYKGEVTRVAKYDYRLTLGPGVITTADIATKWYTTATTASATINAWKGSANDHLWNNAANWYYGVPGGGGTVNIIDTTPGNYPIISASHTAADLYVGAYHGNPARVDVTGGNLSSALINVGPDNGSVGTFNQGGGTVSSSSYFVIGGAGGSQGTYNLSNGVVNAATGAGVLTTIGSQAGATGTLSVSGGTFNSTVGGIYVGEAWTGSGTATGTLNLSGPGVVNTATAANGIKFGVTANAAGTVNLNGGTLQAARVQQGSGSGTFNFNGGTLKPTASSGIFFMTGLDRANVRDGGAVVDTAGFNVTIGQALEHSNMGGDAATDGGLLKAGAGTLTLTGANTYNGPTTIRSGTLALSGGGSINASRTITISNAANFNVSAVSFDLGPGKTLQGNGTVTGLATIHGTVAPGASIGTLTFSTAPVLSGTTVMEIDRTHLPNADRLVVSSGPLNYGGALTVTNIGPALQGGDSFNLFQAGSIAGSFASLNLPPVGADLVWNTNNLSNGVLSVVATGPVNLGVSASGALLNISWSADHTGWRLQTQTNNLATGLGTNWFDLPGTSSVTETNFPIDPDVGTVFFRLIYP